MFLPIKAKEEEPGKKEWLPSSRKKNKKRKKKQGRPEDGFLRSKKKTHEGALAARGGFREKKSGVSEALEKDTTSFRISEKEEKTKSFNR